jgi:hypothetical protein
MVPVLKIQSQKHLLRFIQIVLVFSVLVISCKVTLVPTYDADIAKQIELVTKKVDKFYLTMFETTTESNGREYSNFVKEYIDIEVELNSLLNTNRVRPLNTESTRNCEIARDIWVKYKEKHKSDNGISDVDIELNLDYLRDLFVVIQIGEGVKNKVTE